MPFGIACTIARCSARAEGTVLRSDTFLGAELPHHVDRHRSAGALRENLEPIATLQLRHPGPASFVPKSAQNGFHTPQIFAAQLRKHGFDFNKRAHGSESSTHGEPAASGRMNGHLAPRPDCRKIDAPPGSVSCR